MGQLNRGEAGRFGSQMAVCKAPARAAAAAAPGRPAAQPRLTPTAPRHPPPPTPQFIAAAGNSATSSPSYPAAYSQYTAAVIGVASLDASGARSRCGAGAAQRPAGGRLIAGQTPIWRAAL